MSVDRIPMADVRSSLGRGVYKAPWWGPNGEWVFVVVRSDGALLGSAPVILPWGCDLVSRYEELWGQLDLEDPLTDEIAKQVRRRRIRVV